MSLVSDFAPDDVRLGHLLDLVNTFGRFENECAAALLIIACQARGSWGPVEPDDIRRAVLANLRVAEWLRNPFFRPDFDGLARTGAITRPADRRAAIVLLEPFFAALRPRALAYRDARADWAAALRWADDGGALCEVPA